MSVDGGATWRKVGRNGEGEGWYNTPGGAWSGPRDAEWMPWHRAQIELRGAAGHADVRVRFVFSSTSSYELDGIAIDDVLIDNQYVDLAIAGLGIPESTCRSTAHPIAILVHNDGFVPTRTFTVSYAIDDPNTVTETVTHTIVPGVTYTHLFAGTADLGVAGPHAMRARVTAALDERPSNDEHAQFIDVENRPIEPLGAGYASDFEADAGGWTAGGMNSTWEHGVPAGPHINTASSGRNVWTTGLTGPYRDLELSWIASPCFDFSALTSDPIFSLRQTFQTAARDGAYVEVYTPVLGRWVRLGTDGAGTNWYRAAEGFWSGTTAWRTATHPLTGTAGQKLVRVRVVFSSNASTTEDGIAIDDVAITP
jgi:hypothetical protein